jgi:signal transduction histidine kinase
LTLVGTKKVIEELEKSGELELFGAPSESWLGVPLVIDGKAIGVFAVQSYDNETAFNESDIAILEIISYQISTSIDRKRKVEELKTALEKAQESDRLKSAFLANMSHEIRTPMNGIIGFTNLLNTPEIDKEERQQYIAIINKSGNRLLNTINDLIDISKIEAGQMKISKAKTSVNNILLEVNSFFKHETASKGLSIISLPTLSEKEATIITDQDKLLGILTNLIKNAIKFTKKGSITFGYFLKGNFLEFFVKDTGIGIPENRRQAVFNRFEQADIGNGYTRSFEGSGLGLAISQDYVKMLGGRIWLTSEEGKGTTFRFTIPYDTELVQPPEIPVKARQPSRKEVATKTLDLLIAEDEETSFLYLKTILNDRFRKIYYAKTGKETIKICKENPKINIILMDIKMPDINGLEATREIRIFNKDVVIIAQTAFALAGDEEKAIAAGCNDYISKPIDRDKLIRLINQYI